jgi:uncharacterized protein YndB with AHSA1/START domain
MADVLFQFDVDAPPAKVLEAVKTTEGIQGFWTTNADVPEAVGEVVTVGFAIAPMPFDLRLEQSDESTVVWRTKSFPPHWVGTTIRWEVDERDGGSTVRFRHGSFGDDWETGAVAYTWGQIMIKLKQYVETGKPDPVFG